MQRHRRQSFGLGIVPEKIAPVCSQPNIITTVQGPPTADEIASAAFFMEMHDRVRDSQLHSDYGTRRPDADGGLGDGVKRYSDRYIRKNGSAIANQKELEELVSYYPDQFPQELRQSLGQQRGTKRKFAEFEGGKTAALDRIFNLFDDGKTTATDEDRPQEDDDDDETRQEDEDDFDEDEDGDYNAERYFDDGEEIEDLDEDNEAAY
ncbi:hypothetical protein CANCADRAFT_148313 [Tortispora caseinolytica NRRL Y-17796]|uniref:DNA-directed RNA polymerase III subunit n=1 Tax=Tortispora caseinolytica NRRL Y-17796 TaxID=767744 RepID=A0A1E4TA40_9ASCO|nr:hypothetical protein CANCADRAFT_148313 [Tortispora caseinolytica NRRL Y-17796]